MNTKNTKMNTNMKKSTPEVVKAAAKTSEVKIEAKSVTKATPEAKAETKPVVKADRPKLTAAYIKEMVAKGLSPLTGKPIRHYSREGKRYAGKVETVAVKVEATKAEAKPVMEKAETKTVKAEAKPVAEKVETKTVEAPAKAEASKPAIPVLKAKKTVKKAKKA